MFSYKKVGGLHFVKAWKLGFSFYIANLNPAPRVRKARPGKPIDAWSILRGVA